MRILIAVLVTAVLAGCAGKVDFVRPTAYGNIENSKTIAKPRDTVWNETVPQLGKQYFVINYLDKESGLISLSYSGDPESFVDCGRITSYVKNVGGERTYDFPAARAYQTYEIIDGNGLFSFERKMSLEGRINLIFEETGPNSTRITANMRYVVTLQQSSRKVGYNIPQSRTDAISFNSGGGASFPPNKEGRAVECISTGNMERDLLSLIK